MVVQNVSFTCTALNRTCLFPLRQLQADCIIDMEGKNLDIQTSRVPGLVTLIDMNQGQVKNYSCHQTKDVIIYNGEGTEMFTESTLL